MMLNKAWGQEYGFILLLLSLVGLLIVPPYWQSESRGLAIGTLLTAVMFSFILLVIRKRWVLAVAMVLAVPALAYNWRILTHEDGEWFFYLSLLNIIFYSFIVIVLIRNIVRRKVIDFNIIAAAICVYFMMGVVWTFIYVSIEASSPGAILISSSEPFSQLFYFSFVTMTTLGYGDILPISTIAKHWVVLQAITGQFYLAIMIARLVGLYKADIR